MKKILFLLAFIYVPVMLFPQSIPDGYILLYQQNLSADTAIRDFKFSNPGTWKTNRIKGNDFLEFSADTIASSVIDSPAQIGILAGHIFGDFILEADLMQTNNSIENPDLCIFYSIKDPFRYYAINLASKTTDSTHGIFLVKNANPVRVSDWQNEGISWGNQKWNKIRVERSIVTRTIKVFFNDMKKPVMTTRNPELVMGYLGFGSYNGAGCIDNIKIWAPTSIPEEAVFYEKKTSP